MDNSKIFALLPICLHFGNSQAALFFSVSWQAAGRINYSVWVSSPVSEKRESNRWVWLRSVTISGYSRQISPAPQAVLLSYGMRGTMSLTGVQKIKSKNSIKWKCFPANNESEKNPIFITFNCFISIELIANACTLPHFQQNIFA